MQHPGWRLSRGRIGGSTNDAFGTRRHVDGVRVVARPRAGCDEGTPKRRRWDEKGEISAGREGGADASGARGALGNSPAARAFATRGAVAPILPAKETVRAAILTLRVCVLKWMTAGGQKSSWRPPVFLPRLAERESRRCGREMGTVDPGPRFRSAREPVLQKSKKRGSGPKLADRPLQSSPRLPGKISALPKKSQRQLGKELCNRRYCNFKIRTPLSNYHVVPDRAPLHARPQNIF